MPHVSATSTTCSHWAPGPQAWDAFVQRHPELGYPPGRWAFHNFLRIHRATLIDIDAIRLARNRHWIVHLERFCVAAFDLATGRGAIEPMVTWAAACLATKDGLAPSEDSGVQA